MYVELHAASAFSFLEGASLPERLVDRAAELGYPALALLDRDGVYGIPRFHLAARRAGIKAIVGAELTIRSGGHHDVRQSETETPPRTTRWSPHPPTLWRLPVLVATRDGYRNLCRLVTKMKLSAPKGEAALTLDDLDGHAGGLIALVGRAALDARHYGVGGLLDRVVGIVGRDRTFVELQRHRQRDQEHDNDGLAALAAAYRVPLVATGGVRFATEAERPLFDVLTCLRHQTTISRAGRRLSWNAERYLKAPAAMAELFADRPDAVAAAGVLADRIEYTMADLGYRFPDYPVPDGETQVSFLRKIADAGARDRYRPFTERARAQVTRELDLIEKLELAGYFLIVWDIVNFCRRRGILVQGRGSAANSAVCYSLGITSVDPVGMELLFERFLSEERGEWPDIDLDLPSGDRREEAIQYLYGRYGRLGAAMTANLITYRGRSAARDVGKVLEMDQAVIDRMAKGMNPFEWQDPKETIGRYLSDTGLDAGDARVCLFADLWARIQDLPRHLGQHSGGMVICQGRLDEVVPLEPATMPDRVVIQWDKEDCADMGIVKVDLLGLGMMAVLQDAIAIVNRQIDRQRVEAVGSPPAGDRAAVASAVDRPPLPSAAPPVRFRSLEHLIATAGTRRDELVTLAEIGALNAFGYDRREALWQTERAVRPSGALYAEVAERDEQDERGEASGMSDGGRAISSVPAALSDDDTLRRWHDADRPPVEMRSSADGSAAVARPSGAGRSDTGGEYLDLARLPPDDPAIYRMLQEADTIGIFQVESRAQMATLPRLKPACFYDLVVEVAIIRPGPIVGQMVHPYLKRRKGEEAVLYAHPSLEPILERTLGVPLFQEQLLRMAMTVAGFTGGEAEELRRAMGFKRSEKRMQQIEGRLRAGMAANGIIGAAADAIVLSITSFALYGFPESHAASFALIVYASAYLKVYYPAAFYAALLNNQPMGFYHPATLVKDAQRHGVRFTPVDVQASDWDCRVDEDGSVRLGLKYVAGMREDVGRAIERTPRVSGDVAQGAHADERVRRSLERTAKDADRDRVAETRRPPLSRCPKCGVDDRTMLEISEEAGAPRRVFCRVCAHDWIETPVAAPRSPESSSSSPLAPMSPFERVVADYAGTGLTIGPHPMALRRNELALRGVLRAIDLPRQRAGRRVRVAGAVITRQRPGTAKGFVFLTLEDETGISNVIVQPPVYDTERHVIVREPFVVVEGILQQQDGVTSVKAERVTPLSRRGPDIESHDFR